MTVPIGYFLKYDIYRNDEFICKQVVRFKDHEAAKRIMDEWSVRGIGEYRNVQITDYLEWDVNLSNHIDAYNG